MSCRRAGRFGVARAYAMLTRRWFRRQDGEFRVDPKELAVLVDLGIDIAAAQGERRHFARCCLDWSERRPHLGGALGAALADELIRRKWLRRDRTPRKAVVTPLGERELPKHFPGLLRRSEEHTSELQSLMRISYAGLCLKK